MEDEQPKFNISPGGLTTGLWSYLERRAAGTDTGSDFLWIGWPGTDVRPEHEMAVRSHSVAYHASPVFVPESSMDRFYHGFCNRTLWPLCHYFPSYVRYEEDSWHEYQRVNAIYADAVLKELRSNDVLWIHDYQLMLVPALVRKVYPEMPIGFFLHIPFPSYEVFRLLPRAWRTELLEGILGANLVGFHTHDYTRDFLTSVMRTLGYEHQLGSVSLKDRIVEVDTFPMGVDFDRFMQAASSPHVDARLEELRTKCAGQKVIFSVDRLDYTKGLINRLLGYELFLKNNPQWRGKVTFIISVAPSRVAVETYQAMKLELEQTVGRIVGTYGDVHWTPLIYQFRNLSFDDIVELYRLCDVAMITPLRDGMNLVAKEFVASRPDKTGVLILSEMAGAAKEMGEALIINPFHKEDFAKALEQALTMPVEDQVKRNTVLQDRLRRYDVNRWAEEFVQAMISSQKSDEARRARLLTGKAQASLAQQYRHATRRALLLDYDGTLVPFAAAPSMARPDSELIALVSDLAKSPANEVAIVSGRPRVDLEEWFGPLPLSLIAEHGMWLRRRGEDWRPLRTIATEWKSRVRPILQVYVDRLPGALLEEKEFSLAWHYRNADPDQASFRAQELKDDLATYTRNIDVQVLEGNKVIEIRNTGVTKGTAAVEWLSAYSADFIFGVGDDWTDEDLFRALPPAAWSVRVGMANTAARYHLASHTAVRRLLREMADGA